MYNYSSSGYISNLLDTVIHHMLMKLKHKGLLQAMPLRPLEVLLAGRKKLKDMYHHLLVKQNILGYLKVVNKQSG